jgi:GDP-L-fucose synthase
VTALEGVTLVTGGRGFLGRHLVDELEQRGAEEVRAVGRSDGDLTEQADVRRILGEVRPRTVFHLAAEVGGIGANLHNPGRYFYANAVMGAHLIEESREAGVEKFVQVGTVCSYPKHTEVPFDEGSIWDGYPEETNAPYGIAKRALLAMLQAYRVQYKFNGIYLLPANLYGPGDNFDPETSHVIPALIRRFTEATSSDAPDVQLWGTGKPSREFLHVRDAARAIVLATLRYESGDPVNIGTGVETSIRDLAETIARLTGYQGEIRWDPSRPDGQPRRSLSTRRAEQHFGFRAEVNLETGLRETIDWWRSQGV